MAYTDSLTDEQRAALLKPSAHMERFQAFRREHSELSMQEAHDVYQARAAIAKAKEGER